MKKNIPKVSIIIPTYNEERNIAKCLSSIFGQNYPKSSLEVLVVDDRSDDQTVEIAKKFPVKILFSGARHGEISKMIGLRAAKGDLFIYLDADIELRGKDWIRKMIKPLVENQEIIGSFTRYYVTKKDPAIERYLTFDPLQRDSIYQFFSPSIEKTVIKRYTGYELCEYTEDNIPPAGLCLYRRDKLLSLVKNFEMFLELDFLMLLVRNGLNKFAYVPQAGMYHHHADSLQTLIKKRIYNLTKVYLTHVNNRLYIWFDLSSPKDQFKIILWVIYANLLLPSLIVGLYKSIKYKDVAGLYELPVNLLVTDNLVLFFLKDRRGKSLLKRYLFRSSKF